MSTRKDFKSWFTELPKGLFLASLMLLGFLGLLALIVRANALPDLAEQLPAGETEAFWVLNRDILLIPEASFPAQMTSFMGTPVGELRWVNRVGGAWIDGQTVQIVEASSLSEAEAFLKSLLLEGEGWESEQANRSLWSSVSCFTQGQPYCFTWVGDLLFVAGEKTPLIHIQETSRGALPNLESSTDYQNVRGRLAQWNGGFYYIDIAQTKTRFMDDFGALSSLLELFPATGGVLQLSTSSESGETTLLSENFLAVDKERLNGEGFYSPSAKYEQLLLPWTTEALSWEWGGQNLASQWSRIEEILEAQSPASALVWRSTAENKGKAWLGSDFSLEELVPLLDGEQYFAFTPGEDFLFMATLENEEELILAGQLKDRFVLEGGAWDPALEVEVEHYRSTQTYHFTQGGEELVSMAFLSNVAVLSGSRALLLSTVDKILGQAKERDLTQWSALLVGSDELLILHCPLLPDGTILKALWEGWENLSSTRKLFDDGIFTRTHLAP